MRHAVRTNDDTFSPGEAKQNRGYLAVRDDEIYFLKNDGSGRYIWLDVSAVTASRLAPSAVNAKDAIEHALDFGADVYEFDDRTEMFRYVADLLNNITR